jgi:hypothetical protein
LPEQNKDRTKIAYRDKVVLPYEKWLAAFIDDPDGTGTEGNVFLRQFHASGFYEAYSIVASYAEKSQTRILWFQEKRVCGLPYSDTKYTELESNCTYCNDFFSGDDIPCPDSDCSAVLCSRKCLVEHNSLKHSQKGTSPSFSDQRSY